MTGRQKYDRTKDRQRILDEYMIDSSVSKYVSFPFLRFISFKNPLVMKFLNVTVEYILMESLALIVNKYTVDFK